MRNSISEINFPH